MFDLMLKMDTIRGPHSTGIFRVGAYNKDIQHLIKDVGTPWDLINKHGKDYRNGGTTNVAGCFSLVMGHNRWATVGKVTPDNAHPFDADNIVGAHNGTISGWHLGKLDDNDKFETDSECIMHNINKHGVKETIGKIDGAWALVYYDDKEHTVNFLRNKERPMYTAWHKNGKKMYYSSDKDILLFAANRYKIDLQGEPVSMPVDTLHTFKLNDVNNFSKDRLVTETIKGWTPPPIKYKTTSNVIFSGGGKPTENFTKGSLEERTKFWVERINKDEIFYVVGDNFIKDEQGKFYIPAKTSLGATDIRIYTDSKSEVYDILNDINTSLFKGTIKKVKQRAGNIYLLLDMRTINAYGRYTGVFSQIMRDEVSDKTVSKDTGMAKGYKDVLLTYSEFQNATRKGCLWCGSGVLYQDHEHLKWLAKDEFVCESCKSIPDVEEYIQQA